MASPAMDFNELINAAIEVCKAAVSDSEGSPYTITSNEAAPYFFGRVGAMTLDKDGDEIDVYTVDLTLAHVVGNYTEGVPGEVEEWLNDQMAAVIAALLSADLLQSAAEPDALTYLEDARLTACSGFTILDGKGIGTVSNQIGTTYTIQCILRTDNLLAYE